MVSVANNGGLRARKDVELDSKVASIIRNYEENRLAKRNNISKNLLDRGSVDLHIHTTASDGLLSPQEAIIEFIGRDGKIMSFMDHDDFSASEAMLQNYVNNKENREFQIKPSLIPSVAGIMSNIYGGAELSTGWEGNEIHVKAIGYSGADDSERMKELTARLNETKRKKREARLVDLENLNDRLESDGYFTITEELVDNLIMSKKKWHIDEDIEHYFGTPQMVETAVMRNTNVYGRKGYLEIEQVYRDYIKQMKREKWDYPDVSEMVGLAKDIGLVTTIAHPGRYDLGTKEIEDLIRDSRVDGLEVFYPTHTELQTGLFIGMAERYGLLKDVGSDHHTNEIKNEFGVKFHGNYITENTGHIKPMLEALQDKDLGASLKEISQELY